MKSLLRNLGALALAGLLLIGCGGGGAGNVALDPAIKNSVKKSVANGFAARSQSAASSFGPSRRPQSLRTADESGPIFYYDEYFELWYQENVGGGGTYYVDEAKTQEAGNVVLVTTGEGFETYYKYTTTITAGPKTGWTAVLEYGFVDGGYIVRYNGNDPTSGTFTFDVVSRDGIVTFKTTKTDLDGVRRNYEVSYSPGGVTTVSYNNDKLFDYVLNYEADGSGSGTVTGNSPVLPATITWDTEGNGQIRFADDSVLPFQNFNFEF